MSYRENCAAFEIFNRAARLPDTDEEQTAESSPSSTAFSRNTQLQEWLFNRLRELRPRIGGQLNPPPNFADNEGLCACKSDAAPNSTAAATATDGAPSATCPKKRARLRRILDEEQEGNGATKLSPPGTSILSGSRIIPISVDQKSCLLDMINETPKFRNVYLEFPAPSLPPAKPPSTPPLPPTSPEDAKPDQKTGIQSVAFADLHAALKGTLTIGKNDTFTEAEAALAKDSPCQTLQDQVIRSLGRTMELKALHIGLAADEADSPTSRGYDLFFARTNKHQIVSPVCSFLPMTLKELALHVDYIGSMDVYRTLSLLLEAITENCSTTTTATAAAFQGDDDEGDDNDHYQDRLKTTSSVEGNRRLDGFSGRVCRLFALERLCLHFHGKEPKKFPVKTRESDSQQGLSRSTVAGTLATLVLMERKGMNKSSSSQLDQPEYQLSMIRWDETGSAPDLSDSSVDSGSLMRNGDLSATICPAIRRRKEKQTSSSSSGHKFAFVLGVAKAIRGARSELRGVLEGMCADPRAAAGI